ncbi:hypothetical protein H2201_002981 [Coniosporium apollinis]|uniref:Uncharacterized protein n=1 Tax=Coniosporium apollinis TaxID=61459 RepID=A0ABQ9P395_9PEZI|nr:hypothetical protein H2201_002981 [Coniosporium apollinis]
MPQVSGDESFILRGCVLIVYWEENSVLKNTIVAMQATTIARLEKKLVAAINAPRATTRNGSPVRPRRSSSSGPTENLERLIVIEISCYHFFVSLFTSAPSPPIRHGRLLALNAEHSRRATFNSAIITIVMYIVQPLDIIIRGGVDLYHWHYGGETKEQISACRPPTWAEYEAFREDRAPSPALSTDTTQAAKIERLQGQVRTISDRDTTIAQQAATIIFVCIGHTDEGGRQVHVVTTSNDLWMIPPVKTWCQDARRARFKQDERGGPDGFEQRTIQFYKDVDSVLKAAKPRSRQSQINLDNEAIQPPVANLYRRAHTCRSSDCGLKISKYDDSNAHVFVAEYRAAFYGLQHRLINTNTSTERFHAAASSTKAGKNARKKK